MTHYLVRNDTGSQVEATLTRQSTGATIDVSTATTVMNVRAKNTTITLFTVTGVGPDKADGVVLFPLGNNLDLDEGIYEGEIEITHLSGAIESVYELIRMQIREDF